MEINTGVTPASDNTKGFEKIKTSVADKLHQYAEKVLRTAEEHADCGLAQQGKWASEMLERSADCVRKFDYEQTNARIRDSVKKRPGRALLIAGAAGLVFGILFRRR